MNSTQKKIIVIGLIDTFATILAALCIWGIAGSGVEEIHPLFANPNFNKPVLAISIGIWITCMFRILPLFKEQSKTINTHSRHID